MGLLECLVENEEPLLDDPDKLNRLLTEIRRRVLVPLNGSERLLGPLACFFAGSEPLPCDNELLVFIPLETGV